MGGPAHQAALLSGRRFFPDRYETLLVHGSLAPGEESLAHLAVEEGATLVHMPALMQPVQPANDALALTRLRRIVRRFRPDIVHTHTAKAGFIGRQAAILSGSRRPLLAHTFHGHVLEGYFGSAKSALYRHLERRLGRRTDALIGVSQATVDDLVRLGIAPADRFRVVPLGLDLSRLAAIDRAARERARAELGVASGEIVCTFIGRIAPVKRVDVLLDSFAAAYAADSRLRLWIVGDGEERPRLEERAASLGLSGVVRFHGYRRDLVPIWAASDIAVLSSRNEGTPVALIEAAAAGLPAVSTDVGGVKEALAPEAAVIVPAAEPAGLAAGLIELAADDAARERRGTIARDHALARFNADRLLADVDDLYGELLRARG